MKHTTKNTKLSFSQILDNVIISAYNNKEPITNSKKEIVIGDLLIITSEHEYNIVDKETGSIKYSNIYLIEAAFLIAKYIQLKDASEIKKILKLEKDYAKYHNDMIYYHRTCTNAKIDEDYTKLDIFQIRYKDARGSANFLKQRIRSMCNAILKK